jgi:hypothetical protein
VSHASDVICAAARESNIDIHVCTPPAVYFAFESQITDSSSGHFVPSRGQEVASRRLNQGREFR